MGHLLGPLPPLVLLLPLPLLAQALLVLVLVQRLPPG